YQHLSSNILDFPHSVMHTHTIKVIIRGIYMNGKKSIEEYRIFLKWSKSRLAQEAGIDRTTLDNALDTTKTIYKVTAQKIAEGISKGLQEQGLQPISYTELAGLRFAD